MRAVRVVGKAVLLLAGFCIARVALYRVVVPPVTPLMLRRPPDLVAAVIAAEDIRFCGHAVSTGPPWKTRWATMGTNRLLNRLS